MRRRRAARAAAAEGRLALSASGTTSGANPFAPGAPAPPPDLAQPADEPEAAAEAVAAGAAAAERLGARLAAHMDLYGSSAGLKVCLKFLLGYAV